jgi:hypothetical protein
MLCTLQDQEQAQVANAFQGTLSHMAPEVLREGKQSKAADVSAVWGLQGGGGWKGGH